MKSEGGNRAGEELWGKHSGKLLIMLYLPNVSSISQALNEALNPATLLGSIVCTYRFTPRMFSCG